MKQNKSTYPSNFERLHCYYPYNSGYSTGFIRSINTKKLFEVVANAPRTGLSDDLIETHFDRVTDRKLSRRFEGFSVAYDRNIIGDNLLHFISTNTQDLIDSGLSKQDILIQKGYSPSISYDENQPVISVQYNTRGKDRWCKVRCTNKSTANKLNNIISQGQLNPAYLNKYGKIILSGWGKKAPMPYSEWYRWDESYFKMLVDCEHLLKSGASFEKDGQHIIELAAKKNHTELFYYLLMQAWDKAGYYGMVDLSNTKHIDPESLPNSLKQSLSMSLFWAIQHGNPVIADIALHYGADSNYLSPLSDITPLELALYYDNDIILNIIEERDNSVKHRISIMRSSTAHIPAIDHYYQEKAAYVTENVETDESRKRETFLSLLKRLKKNNFLYSEIQEILFQEIKDYSIAEVSEFIREPKTNISSDTKHKLRPINKLKIIMPEKLLKAAEITQDECWQILKELTIATLLRQEYQINLPCMENQFSKVDLPASLRDTLAGQILMDADYFMKAAIHYPDTYFPLDLQKNATSELKNSSILSYNASAQCTANQKMINPCYQVIKEGINYEKYAR